ncbi:MAG: hypothetical protein JSR39_08290 [Verrucomicrobia bacterium]|nr:hypothetical protein [Verrucomicrobiota bacterium]
MAVGGALPFEPNYQPLLRIVQDEIPVLLQSRGAKGLVDIIDSSALATVTAASAKNIPYTFLSEQTGTNTFYHGTTARLRYLESGLMSVVSLVHNVAFAVVFTALAIVTFGQVQAINDLFRREWMHAGLSLGCIVASLAGTIIPKAGQLVNVAVAGLAAAAVIYTSQRDTIDAIKGVYLRNRERFQEASRALVQNNDEIFNVALRPALGYIDRNLEGVQTYNDLLEFGEGLSRQLPPQLTGMLAGMIGGGGGE